MTSERVNALSAGAELFYRRLMSVVDDYGRFEAHVEILRARCFPLQLKRVKPIDVLGWLDECSSVKTETQESPLLRRYSVKGKYYLELDCFGQRLRSESKYPNPAPIEQCVSSADKCEQVSAACGHPQARASNTHTHTTSPTNTITDSERQKKPEKERSAPEGADPLFEEFWKAYWRRVARSEAMRAYHRNVITPELHAAVMVAVSAQKPSLMARDISLRPHASTWLNQHRWEDEPEPVPTSVNPIVSKLNSFLEASRARR